MRITATSIHVEWQKGIVLKKDGRNSPHWKSSNNIGINQQKKIIENKDSGDQVMTLVYIWLLYKHK